MVKSIALPNERSQVKFPIKTTKFNLSTQHESGSQEDSRQGGEESAGPSIAGLMVTDVGFPWLMRGMGVMNIIYCPLCYFLRKAPNEAEDDALLGKEPKPKYSIEKQTVIDEARFFYGRLCEDDD
ncbi:chromaffin granule amine transporter [Plakobranchus ocellatus]|uniref:Chromaffin granule amine transporter n=1 Tax=Plakobranchus ocellatus TaxID=259542 RepID=A0AAV4DKP8_9GAST|nr:chromaffin granule amine transporter [Plakobranchus ocellatus]